MNKNKELAKNTLIITIGKISTQLLSFFLLPLYTTLLTTEEYGAVDLVNTYVQLFLPIVILQMDQALLRFIIIDRNSIDNVKKCITTSYLFFFFQVTVFSAFFWSGAVLIKNEYAVYLYANIIAMSISGYVFQTARGFGDNITYSISSFLSGALTIGFNIIFIVGMHMHAEGMLAASVIGNIVASLFVILKGHIIKYIDIRSFDKKILKEMLKYAWPLIPNALIWWIVNASDRSIVLFFLGTSANGILAVSHKFPSLIMTIYNIFHLSWTESAALHMSEKDNSIFFSNVFDIIFRMFVSLCALLIAIIPFLFSVFINENYADSYLQIPIYTLASLFNVIVGLYSVVYMAEMKTGEIAKTSVLSGVINIIVDLVLIRFIGLFAASISSAVAFGIMALYRAIDVRKYIKQKVDILVLVFSVLIIVFGVVSYYSRFIHFQIINLIASIIFALIMNKRIINQGIVLFRRTIKTFFESKI